MSQYYRTSPENSTRIGSWDGESSIGSWGGESAIGEASTGVGVSLLNLAVYAGAAYVGYRVLKGVVKKKR